MSFDDWGRKFVTHNSNHIQQVMYDDHYVVRNPSLAAPSARATIAADRPQAEVYRTSPIEPWRVLRTRLRVAGTVQGIVEGGGRAAGYFTGATGVTIYRGDAWPSEWRGIAVVGDAGGNLVHRKRLEGPGIELVARRIDHESEFASSSDVWFRPVQFANAPDGTLHVIDTYREVIEHPHSIPLEIKRHLDLTSGRQRGRIYRIVPEGFEPRPAPRLGEASPAELVRLLEHPNGWHRETASRLLFIRRDRSAVPLLRSLAARSPAPLGRLHALCSLDGLGALEPLATRPAPALALLTAIEAGRIPPADIPSARLEMLGASKHPAVAAAAARLLARGGSAHRQDALAAYAGCLSLAGDVDRGRLVFRAACASCHGVEGMGHELGPNLASMKSRGPEAILVNVLDPNREVNPLFMNDVCITEDGRTVTGMLVSETATSVTLRRAEGAEDTVLRSDIGELRSLGQSMMPEGLEKQVAPQAMADLIAYLMWVP